MKTLNLILIQLIILSHATEARLGDHKSVNSLDRAKSARPSSTNSYTTAVFKEPMFTIKEYISADGLVFAVTWRGIGHPDLAELFGSYYKEFEHVNAQRPRMAGRHAVRVDTANIVVFKEGHPRDFRGKAYLPSRLPQGFDPGSLE